MTFIEENLNHLLTFYTSNYPIELDREFESQLQAARKKIKFPEEINKDYSVEFKYAFKKDSAEDPIITITAQIKKEGGGGGNYTGLAKRATDEMYNCLLKSIPEVKKASDIILEAPLAKLKAKFPDSDFAKLDNFLQKLEKNRAELIKFAQFIYEVATNLDHHIATINNPKDAQERIQKWRSSDPNYKNGSVYNLDKTKIKTALNIKPNNTNSEPTVYKETDAEYIQLHKRIKIPNSPFWISIDVTDGEFAIRCDETQMLLLDFAKPYFARIKDLLANTELFRNVLSRLDEDFYYQNDNGLYFCQNAFNQLKKEQKQIPSTRPLPSSTPPALSHGELDFFNFVTDNSNLTHQNTNALLAHIFGEDSENLSTKGQIDTVVISQDKSVSQLRDSIIKFIGSNNDRGSFALCRGYKDHLGRIVGNTHWTCLHLRRRGDNIEAYYADSLGASQFPDNILQVFQEVKDATLDNLKEEDGTISDLSRRTQPILKNINFTTQTIAPSAKQNNTNDCGYYAANNCFKLFVNDPPFTAEKLAFDPQKLHDYRAFLKQQFNKDAVQNLMADENLKRLASNLLIGSDDANTNSFEKLLVNDYRSIDHNSIFNLEKLAIHITLNDERPSDQSCASFLLEKLEKLIKVEKFTKSTLREFGDEIIAGILSSLSLEQKYQTILIDLETELMKDASLKNEIEKRLGSFTMANNIAASNIIQLLKNYLATPDVHTRTPIIQTLNQFAPAKTELPTAATTTTTPRRTLSPTPKKPASSSGIPTTPKATATSTTTTTTPSATTVPTITPLHVTLPQPTSKPTISEKIKLQDINHIANIASSIDTTKQPVEIKKAINAKIQNLAETNEKFFLKPPAYCGLGVKATLKYNKEGKFFEFRVSKVLDESFSAKSKIKEGDVITVYSKNNGQDRNEIISAIRNCNLAELNYNYFTIRNKQSEAISKQALSDSINSNFIYNNKIVRDFDSFKRLIEAEKEPQITR